MSLLKLLSTSGFISYNKTVAKTLGVHEAILLGELCSIGDLFNYEEFYFERSKLMNDTALSDSQIRNATKTLIAHELVSVVKKGIPNKYYYTLNEQKILELFSTSATKIKALASDEEIKALELQKLEHKSSKNLSTFNNKNTSKNTNKNTVSADAPTESQNLTNINKPTGQLIPTPNKPKKKGQNQYITVIEELSKNKSIRDALEKYCNFRRKRGLTIDQWQLMVSKFKEDSKNKTVEQIVACIEQCLLNGRNSLYYTDSYNSNNKQVNNTTKQTQNNNEPVIVLASSSSFGYDEYLEKYKASLPEGQKLDDTYKPQLCVYADGSVGIYKN